MCFVLIYTNTNVKTEYTEEEVQAAERIQAFARGRQATRMVAEARVHRGGGEVHDARRGGGNGSSSCSLVPRFLRRCF